MAYLVSIANGNLTSSSSWALVDATSLNDTRLVATTLSITPVASTTFTPGAITVQGVAIQVFGRITTPTGTMTVELFNSTGAVSVRTVTINVSDLPSTTALATAGVGWVYFRFSSSVTLLAATSYTIRLSTSSLSQVSVNSGVSSNWSRALVTTTNQAPATTDSFIIVGELTAAATSTPTTITMNNTAVVSYANTYVGHLGTLTYATASSTNYNLTLAGNLIVSQGGSLIIGSSASSIPSTSTARLQLTCTTALQFTMLVYGTMTTYGAEKLIATKLAADVVVGATNSTTSTSTGWNNGDIIVVPSTTRTYTQYESKTLSLAASGTTLTHNAYTNAHGGNATTKVQADIVNLTRNIVIRSTTGTLLTNKTNIQMFPRSVTSFYYTEFIGLGTGITTANSGICVSTLTTGTFDFQYNSIYEIVVQSAANTATTALQTNNLDSLTTNISNNIFYRLGWSAIVSTIIASINNNNYFLGCLSGGQIILANFAGSGNVFTSNNTPAVINAFYNNSSDCSFYSNNTIGLNMATLSNLTTVNTNLSNFRFWRNNTFGIQISAIFAVYNRSNIISFTDSYFFGNTTASLTFQRLYIKVYFSNSFFHGGTTLVQPNHFLGTTTPLDSIYYDRCYFGYSDSSFTSSPFTHIFTNISGLSVNYNIFSNCYFNSTEITNTTGYTYNNLYGGFRALNYNGVTGSNKEWTSNGTITTDTAIYLSGSKSIRLTPNNNSSFKLGTHIVRVPVKSGNTCTISVNVRKSTTIGSDIIYNGNQPRLMYSFDPVLGNLTETIGSTFYNLNLIWVAQQDFNNGVYWAKTATTTSINQTNSPDSRLTATKVVVNNGVTFTISATNIISGSNTYNIGDIYTFSIYAKKELFDVITVVQGQSTSLGGTAQVKVNLNDGVIISSSGTYVSPTVETLPNDWYRISVTKQMPGTSNNRYAIVPGSTTATTGNGTSGIYIWGAQIVQGTDPGIYTPSEDWQNLTYTTPVVTSDGVAEFYVDCDGNTGWINVDGWNTTTNNDSRGQDYWSVSGVHIEPNYKKIGFSSTFTT